MPDNV